MITTSWVVALIRRQPARLAASAIGVALAVALLGSLGTFLASAKSQMTRRAVDQVAVDWQVELQPGADQTAIAAALAKRPHVLTVLPAAFGSISGLESTTASTTQQAGTTQTTGPGFVLGLPPEYRATFPTELRTLAGTDGGVLLAQQTAANLHAGPGDKVRIGRPGLDSVEVTVGAVVELPHADSLFQKVGAPAGAQPQAPPDNVLIVPLEQWHGIFDPLATARPDLVHQQLHTRLDHALPNDPSAAFTTATRMANRFEVDVAGAALVGDNLAAQLGAARADSLYAQVLFLLLGVPGAVLAAFLTRTLAAAGAGRRRREFALLRARGASLNQLQRLAAGEAAAVALVGASLGLVGAAVVGRLSFGSSTFGATRLSAIAWALGAALVGAGVAAATVAVPARRDAASTSVADARRFVARTGSPRALRYGIDVILLVAAGLIFWAAGRGRYTLVLAPEGVPTISVSYWALAGPVLLWAGMALLAWRVCDALLGRGHDVVRRLLRPLAGALSAPAASSLRWHRRTITSAVVLLALTAAFAISTSVFNATYHQQVEADAVLTNGAPVTVTEPSGARVDPAQRSTLAAVPGVGHVEAMQHRFVYVGADLQDLYGIDPATIAKAGALQDAYFSGGTAKSLMQKLAQQPDAALLSAETVQDFQLQPGDHVRLRVRDALTGGLTEVSVSYAGIVKEFPTAPTDSFVVANASYIAQQTGDPSPGTFLLDTAGASPRVVAARVQQVVGTGAKVTDIDETRRVVGSSLTAVDLAGLTRLELAYAVVLAGAAAGLVLGLGFAQRRRSFAITTALGARPRQLAAFIRSEAAVLAVLGSALGIAGGATLAFMLVKVLTGVFDPPPASLAVPWGYLAVVTAAGSAALVGATSLTARSLRRPAIEVLRDL